MIMSNFAVLGHINNDLVNLMNENIKDSDLKYRCVHMVMGMSECRESMVSKEYKALLLNILD